MISNARKATQKANRVLNYFIQRKKNNFPFYGLLDLFHRRYFNSNSFASNKKINKEIYTLFVIITLIFLSTLSNFYSLIRIILSRKKPLYILSFPVFIEGSLEKFTDHRLHNLIEYMPKNVDIIEIIDLKPTLVGKSGLSLIIRSFFTRRKIIISNLLTKLISSFFAVCNIYKRNGNFRAYIFSYKIRLYIYLFIFKVTKPLSIFVWEHNNRSQIIINAANLLSIKTVGALHGIEMPDYMCNIYHKSLPECQKIDYFFVWNKFWFRTINQTAISRNLKKSGWFIKNHSKIKISINNLKFNNDNSPTFAIIVENLLSKDSLNVYKSIESEGYEFILKARFKNKSYLEKYVKPIQKILKNTKVDFEFSESYPDFVIGTHSSAIFDYAALGSIPIFIYTKQWGDYFDASEISSTLCWESLDEFLKFIINKDKYELFKLFRQERLKILKKFYPARNDITALVNELISN